MNQSGTRASELLGISDPADALDVDVAAALKYRRLETERSDRRLGLLIMAINGAIVGKPVDPSDLIHPPERRESGLAERWRTIRARAGVPEDGPLTDEDLARMRLKPARRNRG